MIADKSRVSLQHSTNGGDGCHEVHIVDLWEVERLHGGESNSLVKCILDNDMIEVRFFEESKTKRVLCTVNSNFSK
jgi:hypothetical protein